MEPTQAPQFLSILPMVMVFLVFYFVVIMPHKKQQKETRKMIDSIQKNDKIVTVGGIHGTVVNVQDKTVVVRIDDQTRIKIDKTAISAKLEA